MTGRRANSHVFHRKLHWDYPVAVRARGCWIDAADGKRYLDACGGAFVANIGHGVPDIGEAMAAQAVQIGYVSGMFMTTPVVEEFAAELAALSPPGLDRVYPLSSGSDAVEAALKLARQFQVERGAPGRHRVIALTPAYHGNTMLALSASAREHYRTLYPEWLLDVVRVPAPYPYRCECGGGEPCCGACSGSALEEALRTHGSQTAAFIAEPVGGSSTGASVAPTGYWRRVRELCDRHGVVFIADEILVGAGRTGTWSALEPEGVVPDIMVLGKGIAGGYAPLAALVVRGEIVDTIARGSGSFVHAQTFSHHPVLCAAGLATLRHLREHQLVERCGRMGRALHRALEPARGWPHVGDVRGRGLLAGIEFVSDASTRAPFTRETRFAETFTRAALDAGLLVWPNVGHANGTDGDLVMLAPPFVVTEEEIGELVSRLRRALDATIDQVAGRRATAVAT